MNHARPNRLAAFVVGGALLLGFAMTTVAASPSPSIDPSASASAVASASAAASASTSPFESFQGATAVATATPPSTDTSGGQTDNGFPTVLLAAGLAASGLALIAFDARRRAQLPRIR